MHDEVCRIDGAVVRPARVHVEVAEDPLAVGERLGRRARPMTSFGELLVQRVELAGDVGEALAFGLPERALGLAPAKVGVLGEPCDLGARELGLLSHPGRCGDCTTGCCCLEPDAVQPRERRDEDAGLREERRSRRAVASRPDVHAVAKRSRDRGPSGERFRPQQEQLPVGELFQRAKHAPQQSALVRTPLEDDQVPFGAGSEQRRVDSLADDSVLARETHGRRLGRLLARRDECIDACEQPVALGLAGRVAKPLGREERSRPSAPARRAARGTTTTASPARSRARRRSVLAPARARGWRVHRPGRRCGCAARSARPGRARPPPSRARRAGPGAPQRGHGPGSRRRARSRSGQGRVALLQRPSRAR